MKMYELPCNTLVTHLEGCGLEGALFCPVTTAHSATDSIWFYSPNTQTEKSCVPQCPPRLSLALPHVVTLIIVFFHMFHTCKAKIHLSSIQPGNLEHKSL